MNAVTIAEFAIATCKNTMSDFSGTINYNTSSLIIILLSVLAIDLFLLIELEFRLSATTTYNWRLRNKKVTQYGENTSE